MGDVLPPKRQTVVERLKRRFELYRRHQSACLPRYEQAAHGLYDVQRQDTLLLKQRFLESKAKKAKSKSDHHRTYKESTADGTKSQLHSKPLKRSAEDSIPNTTSETINNEESEKPAKISRTETVPDKTPILELPPQQPTQQSNIPAFSVQIVQQFSQSPLNQPTSQTIQTNVTVQPLNSPLSQQAPQPVPVNPKVPELPTSNQENTLQPNPTAPNLGTNSIECKQEKDIVESDLCRFKHSQASNNSGSSGGDRLSDTFPSLEFTDEAGENVLHPDILNDLIEDVFTNSADIMKDFNFEDSVGSMKDSEDTAKDLMDLVKGPSPTQQRSFQTNNLSFVNAPNNQQNGLFQSMTGTSETPISSISPSTLAPVTTTSAGYYNGPAQRLPSYGNSSLALPNGLGLDFKINEPSPAALTLKQMAEQHQNMQQKQQQQHQQQQQQLVNSSQLSNRPPTFNQDTFATHLNPLRPSNYLNGANSVGQNNSPKMPNSGASIFNSFDQHMNNFSGADVMSNFPTNIEPVSPNNMFESEIRSRNSTAMSESNIRGLQLKLTNHPLEQQQQKPPAYNTTRPLTHYSDSAPVRHQNLANSQPQQQPQPMGRQFQNNAGVRLQMSQVQQMQPRQRNAQQVQQDDPKQQHMMQPHSSMYGNYASQQTAGSPSFHVTMSQSLTYSPQFSTNAVMNRPPPEYKVAAHHHSVASDNLHLVEQLNAPSQVMFNQSNKNKYAKQQRPPNVTITPDGSAISSSHDWRNNVIGNQVQQNQFRVGAFTHQENYNNLNSGVPPTANVPLSPIYSQYRMPANQMPNSRMARPGNVPPNHMMVQQRQRLIVPQRPRMPSITGMESHASIAINNNPLPPNNVMGPMYSNHQEISRQDGSHISLDFLDNIESSASDLLNFDQVMQGPHFPILDDMDILGK